MVHKVIVQVGRPTKFSHNRKPLLRLMIEKFSVVRRSQGCVLPQAIFFRFLAEQNIHMSLCT